MACIFPSVLIAQFHSTPKYVITNPYQPKAIFTYDFDEDNDQDLLVAEEHRVGIFDNTGGVYPYSQYEELFPFSNGNIHQPQLADLNSDGFMDVIFIEEFSGNFKIIWCKLIAGKLANRKILLQTNSWIEDYEIIEVDGDGIRDIVVSTDNEVFFYKHANNNGGFFDPETISLNPNNYFELLSLDLNNDQFPEIFAVIPEGLVIFDNPAGTFSPEENFIASNDDIQNLHFRDMDGDSDFDLLAYKSDNGIIGWYTNINNDFSDFQSIDAISDLGAFYFFDKEGDQDQDILVANEAEEVYYFIENLDNQGNYSTASAIINSSISSLIAISDFDQNGDDDLLRLMKYQGYPIRRYIHQAGLSELVNTGNIRFPILPFISYENDYKGLEFVDLDGDGDEDILANSSDNNFFTDAVVVLINDGNQNYTVDWYDLTPNNECFVKSYDFNQDGQLDILASHGIHLVWFEQLSSVPINYASADTIGVLGTDLVALDIDGDENLDFFYTLNDKFQYKELDIGNQTLSSPQILPTEDIVNYAEPRTYDFDQDGDQDLIANLRFYNYTTFEVYENLNGDGSEWEQTQIFSCQDSLYNIGYEFWLSDIDGDLDKDLFRTGQPGLNTYTYQENSSAGFLLNQHPLIGQSNPEISALTHADLNNDDYEDLIVELEDEGIFFMQNLFGQTFDTPQLIIPNKTNNLGLQMHDVDADGTQDLITQKFGELRWYEYNPDFEDVDGVSITGIIYHDLNENGMLEVDEPGMVNFPTQINGDGINSVSYSNSDGIFLYEVPPGDFEVSYFPVSNWALSSDSLSYQVTAVDAPLSGLEFGLTPTELIESIELSVVSGPTRCHTLTNFWLNYQNTGTTYVDGWLEFIADNLTILDSLSLQPDSTTANSWLWRIENLSPFSNNLITITLEMPDADALGAMLGFEAIFHSDSNEGPFQTLYTSPLTCAYDPNDKLVTPFRDSLTNPTYEGEILEYTIRFQNTGNDTAFLVRLVDILDSNLDWTSIQHIISSHDYAMNLDLQTGKLEFVFENILLPDSTTNFAGSNGFVQFEIQPLPDLPLGTQIKNNAAIFFDFNAPITTNTAINTISEPSTFILGLDLDSAPTRCHDIVDFSLNIQNLGNTATNGWIEFDPDDLTLFYSASITPDSIEADRLFWRVENFIPTSTNLIDISLEMPDQNSLAYELSFETKFHSDSNPLLFEYLYQSELRCPNVLSEKLVIPFRDSTGYPIYEGEVLEYTINFQNIGNDTAFLVRLEDILDSNLDWNSLEVVDNSHSYEMNLDLQTGVLTINFNNIQLPDSTSNLDSSSGFIKFEIQPIQDLPIGTQIMNKADLFFDLNPPISTNEVLSTITEENPLKTSQTSHSQYKLKVQPNPFTNEVCFSLINGSPKNAQLTIIDVLGKTKLVSPFNTNICLQNDEIKLNPGIYFYRLTENTTLLDQGVIIAQ